jgi:sugar/nucleoside kinase (ribokinase family)
VSQPSLSGPPGRGDAIGNDETGSGRAARRRDRRERFPGYSDLDGVVDTTGAGDAFCGTPAACMAGGASLPEAMAISALLGPG